MPSQPEAQGDILKEFREGTFLSSLDTFLSSLDTAAMVIHAPLPHVCRSGYDLDCVQ